METAEALVSKEENANLNNNCSEVSKRSESSSSKPKFENILKLRTCSYFYNHGYCKFGSSCKYKHFKRGAINGRNENPAVSQNVRYYKQIDNNKNILRNYGKKSSLKQNCRYFDMGGCKKAENCEFSHSVDHISDEVSSLRVSVQSQNVPKKLFSSSSKCSRKTPICYYFKKGLCYKGDNCKYYHQNKNNLSIGENLHNSKSVGAESIVDNSLLTNTNITSETDHHTPKKIITAFNRTLNVCDLSSLTADVAAELRSTEINQLKKRFPHLEVIVENQIFSILFEPSDPDWAFDVNKLKIEVDFPADYPIEKCKITVQIAENIPHLLIKYLNKTISDWIDRKFEENSTSNKTELIFRPFLKWFDRNLEDLFITGLRKVKQDLKAKEDGIEFVPVENLFSSAQQNVTENELHSSDQSTSEIHNLNICLADSSQLQEHNFLLNNKISLQANHNKPTYYSGNDGMKIIFLDLEFVEGTAAFICTKVSATLQCSRCKTSFNIKSVPKKSNSQVCLKCSKNVGFMFEPSTVHQFSNVLGTLHLLDCVAVDINLVECHFLVDCLKCSKQVPVDGIHYGQKHKMWCTFCSEKMLLSIGSVKFQAVRLTSAPVVKYPSAKKIERKSKDPIVKEGEPLPDFGACKHYKKSFRWLRFPCCGRLYPCDECHNEKETDHEMKYASRMLCGFCAKEQPYSREKPCILCSQSMTKKSGSHWEGGKGCRNKIQMSREDKQKYSGISKTVSRKAQMNKPKKKH